jgi:HTH-type transcriptional regulator / antitoxin HipB
MSIKALPESIEEYHAPKLTPPSMQLTVTTPTQLGQALLARRKVRRISQAEIAARLGISQNRYSELELHPERMSLDRMLVVAKFLGLELVIRDPHTPPATDQDEW